MNKSVLIFTAIFFTSIAPAADAEKDFNDLFGDQIKKAAGTSSTADDLELAKFMLTSVNEVEGRKDLKLLMLEKAADLAERDAGGTDTALSAVKQLSTLAPEREDEWAEKKVTIYQSLYARSRGAARMTAGKALLAEQLRAGDALMAAGRGADGLAYYRKALAVAGVAGGDKRADLQKEIQAKIRNATEAAAAQKKIDSLKAKLKKDSADVKTREELIRVYLLEYDDGINAQKLLTKDVDDFLQTVVPLAAKSVSDVPAMECRDMGEWYLKQAEEATTTLQKAVATRRARDYFDAFLPSAKSGIDKLKARLQRDNAKKDLTEKYASVKMPKRRSLPPEKKTTVTKPTKPTTPDIKPGKPLETLPVAKMPAGEWEMLLSDKWNFHKWEKNYDEGADVKKVKFEDGILTAYGNTSMTHFRNFKHFVLEAQFQKPGSTEGVMGFRIRPSSAGYYALWFNGREIGIGKYMAVVPEGASNWKTLKTYRLPKQPEDFITVAIGAMGSRISMYVNGHLAGEFTDASYKSGIPVLYTHGCKEAMFRKVRVLIPEKVPEEAEPAPSTKLPKSKASAATPGTVRIEGESMRILEAPEGGKPTLQNMSRWSSTGKWSGGKQKLWYRGTNNGASMTLGFEVEKAGTYDLSAVFTLAPDFGIFSIHLNGNYVRKVDTYGPKVTNTPPLKLGTHKLSVGMHKLKFTIIGKNPKSTKYRMGFDYLDLKPRAQ